MVKLIIDTDPGIDDAMAIFWAAASPDIELLGLTSVFGNVTVDIATRNALRLLEWVGVDAPVAAGARAPQAMPPFKPSSHVHGGEGFGDLPAQDPKGRALDESAAEFLVRMARTHSGELVLCPIGPLTNIAEAIRLDPNFVGHLKRMVIMGGSVDEGGNITPYAEANIYHDPHAAAEVFASGGPILMVGLDVTHQTLCTAGDFSEMAASAPNLGGLLQEMGKFYLHFYETVGKFEGCSLHDPAAVIACVYPELFTTRSTPISVDTEGESIGQTRADPSASFRNTDVCFGVDAAAVLRLFKDGISRLY
jgi:inosine-uridine nucleoside N-ribohydrolase